MRYGTLATCRPLLFLLLTLVACGHVPRELPQSEHSMNPSPTAKIASALWSVVAQMQQADLTATNVTTRHPETYSTSLVHVDPQGRLHCVILVTTVDAETLATLTTQGVHIASTDVAAQRVQAWIPFTQMQAVAALPGVRYLHLPSYARRR